MVGQVFDSNCLAFAGDQAEQTATLGWCTDGLGHHRVETGVNEVDKPTVLTDHAKGSMRRAGEIHSNLNRRRQYRLKIGLSSHGRCALNEVAEPGRRELS
jgi:hypothetical protein